MLPTNNDALQQTTNDIVTYTWQAMQEGKQNYKSELHQFFVANCNQQIPELRTVILRGVEENEKWISFHTDMRSSKVKQMIQNNAVSALFYAHTKRIQIRIRCTASIHNNDAIAEEAWLHARLQSKLSYSNVDAPGTILSEPVLIDVNRVDVPKAELLTCKNNFAVVRLAISAMDIVLLNHLGNKRLLVDYNNNATHWLQP